MERVYTVTINVDINFIRPENQKEAIETMQKGETIVHNAIENYLCDNHYYAFEASNITVKEQK